MFCSKCKKSFEEKYTHCPQCAGELTEEKKGIKLSKKALIIIISSAVALVLCATLILVFALSPKDKKERGTKEESAPAVGEEEKAEEEKEPEYKIMKTTREAAEKIVSDIYPALLECFGEGGRYKGELSCDFDKMVLKLLGYDLPEKVQIDYTLNAFQGALNAELSASIGKNEPFVSASVMIDIIEGMIYVENEELLGGAYYIPLPIPGLEALGIDGEREDICRAIYENFPKEEVLAELLAKYMTVLSDSLGEDTKTVDEELTLEGITQKGLRKTSVNITADSLLSMIRGVKKAVSLDSLLRESAAELFAPIAGKETEEIEKLWKEGVKELSKESSLDTLISSLLGNERISLSLWTDAYYDMVAFEALGESRLYIAGAKYGTDRAYCISFEGEESSFSLKGKGEEEKSLFNGKIGFYDENAKLFDLTLKDFDFANPINGKASFKTAGVVEIAFSAKTDDEKCDASLTLSLFGYKPVKIKLSGKALEGEKITPPEDARGYIRLISIIRDIESEDIERLIIDGGFDISELERLIDDVKKLVA